MAQLYNYVVLSTLRLGSDEIICDQYEVAIDYYSSMQAWLSISLLDCSVEPTLIYDYASIILGIQWALQSIAYYAGI